MTQNQPEFGDIVDPILITECFNISPDDVRTDYPTQWVSTGLPAIIIPLKSLEALKQCAVDHHRFQKYIDKYYSCNHLFFVDTGDGIIRARDFMEDPGFAEDPAKNTCRNIIYMYAQRIRRS